MRLLPIVPLLIAALLTGTAQAAESLRSAAPKDATVYFIAPADGATVPSTFRVKFGLKGMGVAPAGTDREHTGHHHLLIDTDLDDINYDVPLPATDNIVHFGGGQTETEVTLSPGTHRLRLLLGNHVHIPHDPPVVSGEILITVEDD